MKSIRILSVIILFVRFSGIGATLRWIKAGFQRISEECGGCLEVFYVSGVIEGQRSE